VLFELPQFIDNIATTSAGQADEGTGTVTLSPATKSVTVQLGVATTHRPSHSRPLQWYEIGIFVAAAAVLAAVGTLWIRRRLTKPAVPR
jgi:hypothetical protein